MLTRREALTAGAAAMAAGLCASSLAAPKMEARRTAKPRALRPGSRIALPAPASAGDYAEAIVRCRAFVEAQGWTPVEMPHAGDRMGYLAGSDEARAEDINSAFRDESIDGIICIRGGYGTMRILPLLDMKMIRRNPKVLMGFSDITALLVGIVQKAGLTCFHGPNALDSGHPYSLEWMRKALAVPQPLGRIVQPDPLPSPEYELAPLAGGKGEGPLVGGNLTLLSHLMGTPWAPRLEGSILFIEDVGEAPYRIDRMLTQLLISGGLAKCRGVACGQFAECDDKDPESPWKVRDILRDRLAGLGIPVVAGWAIGHVRTKLTLPLGCRAELDGDRMTLTVLDSAVSS